MKKTQNGIRMLSDRGFFIFCTVYVLFVTIVCATTIVFVNCVGKGDVVEASITLAVVFLFLVLAIANGVIKVVYAVELTNDSISFRKAFRKPVTLSYDDLPYVTRAYHYRSPSVKNDKLVRNYIILSKTPILDYYIPRANGLVLSPELVKMEFTKEKYYVLYNIFPESHKKQLVEQFSDLMK